MEQAVLRTGGTTSRKPKIGLDILAYAVYCALYPLDMAMNFSGSGTVSRMVGMVACGLSIFYILSNRDEKFLVKKILMFGLFPVYALISILWSPTSSSGISSLFSLVAMLILLSARGMNEREKSLICWSMMLSTAVFSIWLGFQQEDFNNRAEIVTSGGSTDPNGLAANLAVSLLITLDKWYKAKKHISKILSFSIMIIIIFGIMVTGSRGGAIAAIAGIIFYIVLSLRGNASEHGFEIQRFLIILALGVLVVIFLISYGAINPATIERMFADDIAETGANGRFESWGYYIDAAMESPFTILFGHGYGSESWITLKAIGRSSGAHNVFIGHFATTGIIGLLLMCIPIVMLLRKTFKNHDALACSLLLVVLITCLSLDFYLNKGLWNVFLLAFIGMKAVENHEGGETDAGVLRVQFGRY